ncbi:MAG: ABC transporter permease subunit [Truepera sp.]|nr:ABC transporter permease subunit [Truepera sp.]
MTRAPALLVPLIVVAVTILALLWLFSLPAEPISRGFFLTIPNGWAYAVLGFIIAASGIGLAAYLYGRVTRPGKAVSYALTAATHIFIWVVVTAMLYPVIYLLATSFNRADNIASVPPREGGILVRSGVIPNPGQFSTIQYERVLGETNILPFQWLLIGVFVLALLVLIGALVGKRLGGNPYRLERYQSYAGWTLFLTIFGLVISITPDQFYTINAAGERVPASSERKILLYIRNTLLVSGTAGLFAVLIATTAGYAFARMRFEGRYYTLLTFIFVQMFPGFMALVAIFYLMSYLGLLNTFTGLILAYSGGAIAFSSWIFKGYLESISPSLEEAAMVDGTTRWGAFWYIILPVSIPMLLFIFLLQFIGTYSEFILASTLLIGENNWTVGIGLRNFTAGRFDTQWGALAASAVLGSLPILIIFYAFQGALTGQHTAGGVKG